MGMYLALSVYGLPDARQQVRQWSFSQPDVWFWFEDKNEGRDAYKIGGSGGFEAAKERLSALAAYARNAGCVAQSW